MIKMTNIYLIGLVSASLLIGCGSSSDDSEKNEANEATEHVENNDDDGKDTEGTDTDNGTTNSPTTTPTTTTPTTNTVKTFSADVMPVLNAKCQKCHGDNGDFMISTAAGTYANISDLKASVPVAAKYVLDKGSNMVGHGGGKVIDPSSIEYATIKSWVDSGADFN